MLNHSITLSPWWTPTYVHIVLESRVLVYNTIYNLFSLECITQSYFPESKQLRESKRQNRADRVTTKTYSISLKSQTLNRGSEVFCGRYFNPLWHCQILTGTSNYHTLSDKVSSDKIFCRTKFSTPSQNFDNFVRFLPDFYIEILDKIFRRTKFSTPSRNFDNFVRRIFVR